MRVCRSPVADLGFCDCPPDMCCYMPPDVDLHDELMEEDRLRRAAGEFGGLDDDDSEIHFSDCDGERPCSCAPKPVSLSGPVLRAACETYLRDNGWTRARLNNDMFVRPVDSGKSLRRSYSLGEALDIQWARDGVGGAT